jgi:hypothetical protein
MAKTPKGNEFFLLLLMQDFSALKFNFDLLGNVFIFTANEWFTTRFDLVLLQLGYNLGLIKIRA